MHIMDTDSLFFLASSSVWHLVTQLGVRAKVLLAGQIASFAGEASEWLRYDIKSSGPDSIQHFTTRELCAMIFGPGECSYTSQ
jgi:hypothetical protein